MSLLELWKSSPKELQEKQVQQVIGFTLAFSAQAFLAIGLAVSTAMSYADDEPEKQKESDWVDARWNQTELGNFHSSLVPLPNGIVAKGLSVRVGERGEAAVVYDTASAKWRADWSG